MSIDELRVRKRELLARKKYELERQARGEGDNLALFMVREELLDVNDQLKALTAGRRRNGVRTAASDYTLDRRQYQLWRQADITLDDGIEDTRSRMKAAAIRGLDLLTPNQREIMELHLAGYSRNEIADSLGVARSTVSRTIARARKHLRQAAEQAMTAARLQNEESAADLADPAAANAVMLALTPKQTVYFYLYYSEWLTLREIQALTGTDFTVISRALRRALRNIETLLGGQDTVLKHPEALDELAFQAFCELKQHPELVPERLPMPPPYRPRGEAARHGSSPPGPPVRLSRIRILRDRQRRGTPGKFLSALLERLEDQTGHEVFLWLKAVFSALRQRIQKCRKGETI